MQSDVRRLTASAALWLGLASAWAGTSEGLVTNPLTNQGAFMFGAGSGVQKPACATATTASWVVSLEGPTGRSMQATVLTAFALGKRVKVQGNDTCNVWGDRETASWVVVLD